MYIKMDAMVSSAFYKSLVNKKRPNKAVGLGLRVGVS